MIGRPDFCEIKSYSEFEKYYCYRDELAAICKQLCIDHTGTKQELKYNIKEYFSGNLIRKPKTKPFKNAAKEVTLDCPLLECSFSFNEKFRILFSQLTGVVPFRFTADMAAAWRKVKRDHDLSFTVQDMLDIYEGKSNYEHYDPSCCEWNQFLKDFCADERNGVFSNQLKAASFLWGIVRDSSLPKTYSYELVQKYSDFMGKL